MKPIRNAVKCLLIKNERIVITKYLKGIKTGYYDIPGGKIEDGESAKDAAIREMEEETGIKVSDLVKRGTFEVEYPDRRFIFDIFVAKKYQGNTQSFEENTSEWIKIDDLLKEGKVLSNILLLKEPYNEFLYNENVEVKIKVNVDEEEHILKIESFK